jgi:hypothetical protein
VRKRILGVIVALVVIAAIVGSVLTGAPDTLPSVALDSVVLFHMERAVVAVVVVLVLLRVIERAWVGELPMEFSTTGLKYAVREVRDTTQEALQALTDEAEEARLDRAELRARLDALEEE